MSGLSFGDSICLFGRSSTDLSFSFGDHFFLVFRFFLKLKNCCIAAVSRLEGGEREREHIRVGKINKSYSSSHTEQYFLLELGAKCQ